MIFGEKVDKTKLTNFKVKRIVKDARGREMFEIEIKLPELNNVYDFHKKVTKISCDMDLVATNSKYCVDAKSLMGILSMDLTHPVILKAYTDDYDVIQEIRNAMKDVSEE